MDNNKRTRLGHAQKWAANASRSRATAPAAPRSVASLFTQTESFFFIYVHVLMSSRAERKQNMVRDLQSVAGRRSGAYARFSFLEAEIDVGDEQNKNEIIYEL